MAINCSACGKFLSQPVPAPVTKKCPNKKCSYGTVPCCSRARPCGRSGCLQGQRNCSDCNGVGTIQKVECKNWAKHAKHS
jgi:hypothetical protein